MKQDIFCIDFDYIKSICGFYTDSHNHICDMLFFSGFISKFIYLFLYFFNIIFWYIYIYIYLKYDIFLKYDIPFGSY